MDHRAVQAQLDECTLNHAEYALGQDAWYSLRDPWKEQWAELEEEEEEEEEEEGGEGREGGGGGAGGRGRRTHTRSERKVRKERKRLNSQVENGKKKSKLIRG
jgi:hypothetical protein